jgi:hypothetical protein
MKQTAVQWLIESLEKLEYNLEKGIISLDDYIINVKWVKDQSKEMEKEQISKAYEQGSEDGYWHPENGYSNEFESAEQYYNETYGK